MMPFYITLFNFTILVVFLYSKLKQPVRDFLQNRHESIKQEIQSVHDQLVQAQKMFDEFSAKLESIDQEIRDMREQSVQDIAQLKERVLEETERLSKMIISDATLASSSLYDEFKKELFGELSCKVLTRAEHILKDRLTGDDRSRLRKEFSMQLEAV